MFLDDCEVPETNRLGKEGAGKMLFAHSMTWERACILASAVGSMQRLLDASIAHARTRKQFGTPIGQFQRVADRIVDMKLRVETARGLLYRAACEVRAGQLDAAQRDYEILQRALSTMYQVYFGLGEISYRRKDTNAAIANYEKYLTYAVASATNAPPNPEEVRQVTDRLAELKRGKS